MGASRRGTAWTISILIYALISLLSSIPAASLPETGIPDFIPHGMEYFALAFFFIQVFAPLRRWTSPAAALAILAVLGLIDEWHQLSVPGRVFSWLDLLFDVLGAMAGMAAYRILERATATAGGGPFRRLLGRFILQR